MCGSISTAIFRSTRLRLVQNAQNPAPPDGIDPLFAAVDFSFKVDCPTDFDCQPRCDCPPAPRQEPEIDYLAKDYASFRRLMLDRMAALMPQWQERNPADLGVTLVETFAYVGDQSELSAGRGGDGSLSRHARGAGSRCAVTRVWSITRCTTAATRARGCRCR